MKDPRQPKVHRLDVRPLMARGEEPLPAILALVARLGPADEMVIVTPFLPAPLIERMQATGYEVQPERQGDGSWSTRFRKPPPA
jgi:uncharacterized protein (DUF2249 family)